MNFDKSFFVLRGNKVLDRKALLAGVCLMVMPVFFAGASGGNAQPNTRAGGQGSIIFERTLERPSSVVLCSGENSQQLLNHLTDTPWRWDPPKAFDSQKPGCGDLPLNKHIEELPVIVNTTHHLITSYDRVLFDQKNRLKQQELKVSKIQQTLDDFSKQIKDLEKKLDAKKEELRDFRFNTRRRSKSRGHRRLKPYAISQMEAQINMLEAQIKGLQERTPPFQESFNQAKKATEIIRNGLKKTKDHLNSKEVVDRYEVLKEQSKDIIKDFSQAFEKGCFKDKGDQMRVFSQLVSLSEMFFMKANQASIAYFRPATELLSPLASEQVLRELQEKSSASHRELFLKTLQCMNKHLAGESQKCEREQKLFATEAHATCTTGECDSQDTTYEQEDVLKTLTDLICGQQKGMIRRLTRAAQNKPPQVDTNTLRQQAQTVRHTQTPSNQNNNTSQPLQQQAAGSALQSGQGSGDVDALQDTEVPTHTNNSDQALSDGTPAQAGTAGGQRTPAISDSPSDRGLDGAASRQDSITPSADNVRAGSGPGQNERGRQQVFSPPLRERKKGVFGFVGRLFKRSPSPSQQGSSERDFASLEDQIKAEKLKLEEDARVYKNRSRRLSIRNYYKKRVQWRTRKIQRLQKLKQQMDDL